MFFWRSARSSGDSFDWDLPWSTSECGAEVIEKAEQERESRSRARSKSQQMGYGVVTRKDSVPLCPCQV